MTDWLIKITTALAVVAVAVVAAIISDQHAYELVRSHGETGLTARLLPFTVDGLIWARRWGRSEPLGPRQTQRNGSAPRTGCPAAIAAELLARTRVELPVLAGLGEREELLAAAWLASLRAPRARRAYAGDVRGWLGWLAERGTDVLGAGRVHVDLWAAGQQEGGPTMERPVALRDWRPATCSSPKPANRSPPVAGGAPRRRQLHR